MYSMNLVTFWVDRMNIRKKVFRTAAVLLLSVGAVQLASAGAIATQTITSTVVGARAGDIPATSSVQELEATLKTSYVGTYAIYGSLPEQKKRALYASIKKGGNIQEFREQVINERLHRR